MAQYPTRQSLQRTTAAAAVLALVLATAPVVPMLDADGDLTLSSGTAHAKGKGGGHGRHGRGQNRHADFGADYDNSHAIGRGHYSHGRGCPPGLAKNKHCTPPGQLKKWTKGHSLPQDVYYRPLSNWRDYDLSPPPYGHVYGGVDGDILLIRTATRLVVDAVILAAFAN